jgi:signal transduction histidine kinase
MMVSLEQPAAPEPPVGSCDSASGYHAFAFQKSPLALLVFDWTTCQILAANEAAAKLLDPADAALCGKCFFDFLPESQVRDKFTAVLARLNSAPPGTPLDPFPLRLQRTDHAVVLVEVACSLLVAESGARSIFVQCEDLSRRHASCEPVEAETTNYRDFVKCIGDGFLVLDREGEIIFINTSAEQILQRPRRRLLGQRLVHVFPELGENFVTEALANSAKGIPFNRVQVPLLLRGQAHMFEFGIHPSSDGIGVLFRDISERLQQEAEIAKLNATLMASQELLRHKNNELNHSLEELDRLGKQQAKAERLKSEFLANTSHELRTPLNAIIGFLQLIHEGLCVNHDEELEYVTNALLSAQQLLTLINDLLEITRIEAGAMTLQIENVSLEELFNDLYDQMHGLAQQKGLELKIAPPVPDVWIMADRLKTKQVLLCVIGNAIKFTTEGTVTVWSEAGATPERMRIVVHDSGIGIPLDQQQTIFDKFTQVDGTSTRRYQGTGLGLAISKNLVEMQGGSIVVQSAGIGQGTTVLIELPGSLADYEV